MKYTVEMILVAILIVLMYEKPLFLVEFANSTLGKLLSIIAVFLISHQKGLTAGILAALIVIILRHTWREGMENKEEKKEGAEKKEKKTEKKAPKKPKANSTTDAAKSNKKCSKDLDCSGVGKCHDGVCVSSKDLIGMDRQMKAGAEKNTISATSQSNMHTNN